MASFVVMEPPSGVRDDAVFVRDGFHVLAFLVPWLWLAYHRLWIEALVVLALGLIAGAVASYLGLGLIATVTSFLVALFIGLEGAALKIAALRRRGWREGAVVEADDAADAELRYYTEVEDPIDVEATGAEMTAIRPIPSPSTIPHHSGPVLGMLGYQARN